MVKMKKKGIGAVVGTVLIILISIVAVSILIGVYIKFVKKNTSGDEASCFGIDLKVDRCDVIPPALFTGFGLTETNPGLLINVERFPGGEEIKSLKFIITDSTGNVHHGDPVDLPSLRRYNLFIDTDYSDLVEYNSVDAIVKNITYNLTGSSVFVSAVVGESRTVCAPTRAALKCSNPIT